jgi:hypothetical protein
MPHTTEEEWRALKYLRHGSFVYLFIAHLETFCSILGYTKSKGRMTAQ